MNTRRIHAVAAGVSMAIAMLLGGSGGSIAQERLPLPEEYLLITGGWYLNARCDFLDRPERLEFRDNLMRLDEMARSVLDGSYVRVLRESARKAAYAPARGDCGADDEAVVMETAAMAQSFTEHTVGEPTPVSATNEPIPEI